MFLAEGVDDVSTWLKDREEKKQSGLAFLGYYSADRQLFSDVMKQLCELSSVSVFMMAPFHLQYQMPKDVLVRGNVYYLPKPILISSLVKMIDGALLKEMQLDTNEEVEPAVDDADLEEEELASIHHQAKVLLVEDNVVNQGVLMGVLRLLNLTADVAANGREALDMLSATENKQQYDLVIMDCQMPEMDGYEASRAIRSGEVGDHYRNVVIIAMTANAMSGDREACLKAGMTDYLSKPFDFEVIQDNIKFWLSTLEVPSDGRKLKHHES